VRARGITARLTTIELTYLAQLREWLERDDVAPGLRIAIAH